MLRLYGYAVLMPSRYTASEQIYSWDEKSNER